MIKRLLLIVALLLPTSVFAQQMTTVQQLSTQNLSDVSIGTWTPTDVSGASLTFTTATGGYTKIGNMVFAYGVVTYPSTSNGSNATIGGLPFAIANTDRAAQGFFSYKTVSTATNMLPSKNSTTFVITSAAGTNITNAVMSTGTIYFELIYPVS